MEQQGQDRDQLSGEVLLPEELHSTHKPAPFTPQPHAPAALCVCGWVTYVHLHKAHRQREGAPSWGEHIGLCSWGAARHSSPLPVPELPVGPAACSLGCEGAQPGSTAQV